MIALNEIKPKNGNAPNLEILHIPGFDLFTNDLQRPDIRGTCIYIRTEYKACRYTHPSIDQFVDAVWITFNAKDTSNLIGCVYRSGTPETARQRDKQLHAALRHSSEASGITHALVMGDFNLNRIVWDPEPSIPHTYRDGSDEQRFIEVIRDTYYHQHVHKPTRYRQGQQPTLDDLIFTTEENTITNLNYGPHLGNSDHISLTMNLNIFVAQLPKKRTIYSYDKTDYGNMKEMLNLDWTTLLDGMNTQEATDKLEKIYKKQLMNACHTIPSPRIPEPSQCG